jgi:hypothetical protein
VATTRKAALSSLLFGIAIEPLIKMFQYSSRLALLNLPTGHAELTIAPLKLFAYANELASILRRSQAWDSCHQSLNMWQTFGHFRQWQSCNSLNGMVA